MKLKKNNLFKIVKIMLFTVLVAGLGVATWFITSAIISEKNNNVDPSGTINKEFITLEKDQNTPVKLVEYETNGSYFLGKEGLEKLNEKIKNDLQFGPEIEALKSISMNNLTFAENNVHGQYSPFTEEIDISINEYIKNFQNIPVDQKIDLIYPVIFHEYGHHFMNVYVTSIATNDSRNSKKLFRPFQNQSAHLNIPSVFLSSFERSLNLNDNLINNQLGKDKNYLSGFKTTREIYNASNGRNVKNYRNNSDFLGIDGYNLISRFPFREKEEYELKINSDSYFYYYSMDEMLTRKLQQISFLDNLNGKSIANNSTNLIGTKISNSFLPSTFGVDTTKNKEVILSKSNNYSINEKLKLLDYPYGGTFESETNGIYEINPTVNELWNAFVDIAGYNYGISQIHLDNTSVRNTKNSRTILQPADFKNIKFSGFLDKSNQKNYKSLILKDKKNNDLKVNFLENKYEYKILSVKSTLLSTKRDLVKPINKTKFGYSTNFINISNVNFNEPIKVWNDINKNNLVENNEREALTISPNRPTSTFREPFVTTFEDGNTFVNRDIQGNNFYELSSINNNIFFKIYNYQGTKINFENLISEKFIGIGNSSNFTIFNQLFIVNNNQSSKKKHII